MVESLHRGSAHVNSVSVWGEGKWGLVIGEYIEGMEDSYDGDDEDRGVVYLRDASRDLRIRAAEKLGDLIENLTAEATKVTEKVTKRVAEAKDVASALSKGRN
jgi:hypothetical protein